MKEQKKKFLTPKEIIIVVVSVIVFISNMSIISGVLSRHIRNPKNDLIHEIYSSHYENAAACFEKYDGKNVTFKCEVKNIDASLESITVGSVKSSSFGNMVLCSLKSDELKNKALKLKVGDKIKIKGTLILEDVDFFGFSVLLDTESIS